MRQMKPQTLIIRTAGINCERELAHAFTLAGADVRLIHLNQLIDDPGPIERADVIGFPGGFSYGDDIAAGRILANRLRHRLMGPIVEAIDRGVPMIGVCNGFQALVKMGLLPDPTPPPPPPEGQDEGVPRQRATLADNAGGRFIDRWVRLVAQPDSVCVWTRGLDRFALPIAHGEGRFVPESDEALERWRGAGQIALCYAADDNPNGSVADVAGVCDPSGLVLGLMPHPERYTHATNHPNWTRFSPQRLAETPAGLRLFQNAVRHAAERSTPVAASS